MAFKWFSLLFCFFLYKIGGLCQHDCEEHEGTTDPFTGGGELNASDECCENDGSENCKEGFKAHKNGGYCGVRSLLAENLKGVCNSA